jgi:hypothetical membrane protein
MVVLAVAGIAAPIAFTMLVIVQGILQPDYRHVAMPISALAAWPAGWIQNVNFYVFGVLMVSHAIGLHLGMRARRRGWIGPALLALSGVGTVLAGVFPMTRDATGAPMEPAGHIVAAVVTFLGAGAGLAALSWRMAADPRWRSLAGYGRACGLAIVGLFVAMGLLAAPENGLLHPWFGLLQRVMLAVWFPCVVVLATRLLGVARQ